MDGHQITDEQEEERGLVNGMIHYPSESSIAEFISEIMRDFKQPELLKDFKKPNYE